jgi:hypothetical protein
MPNNNQQQAVYLQSGLPTTENRPPDGYSGGQLGSRFTLAVQDGGNPTNKAQEWQMVVNDSIMDVEPSPGAVAWWIDRDAYRVTTDVSAAGRGNIAGVYPMASDLGNVCCIQKKGPTTSAGVQIGAGTPSAAGLFLIPHSTDAKAEALAAGTAPTYPVLGKTTSVASGSPSACQADLNVDDGTV